MRLSKVIEGTEVTGAAGSDPEIALVTGDSRAVVPGALFFALPGAKQDGHAFAAEAAHRGAAAVVVERPVDCGPALALRAPSTRRAMAIAAMNLHGRPAEAMTLVGVTGTNGKTTVAYLVEASAREAGFPTAMLGTVIHRWPGGSRPASHTTPESTEVAATLATAREAASPSTPPASRTSPATTSTTTATWSRTTRPSGGSSPSTCARAARRW